MNLYILLYIVNPMTKKIINNKKAHIKKKRTAD